MTNRTKMNEGSLLLNESENEAIFSSLGKGNQTLCTGVVQLYLAKASNKHRWTKRSCGVVCFVKDNPKRSYFFRVFDPKSKQMVWEQAVYSRFIYKTPREYFHTFEALDCQAGLNFASEDEAAKFKKVVEGKLLERLQKQDEMKKVHKSTHEVSPPSLPPTVNNNVPGNNTTGSGTQPPSNVNVQLSPLSTVNTVKETSKKKNSGKRSKKALTTKDISIPVDFRHVDHVGLDSNFDIKSDPEMKNLLEQVGYHDQADVDKDTIDFIYDFVGKYGGISAVKEDLARTKVGVSSLQESEAPTETQNDGPPPVPARPPQQTAHRGPLPPTPTPPPPLKRITSALAQPKSLTSSPLTLPANIRSPPPYDNVPQLQPGANTPPSPITNVTPPQVAKLVPPPPPVANISPPAPAAPPLPAPAAPPPPPGVPTMTGRTELLPDIQKHSGKVLPSTDGRGELLSQIRFGTALKPVTPNRTSAPQSKTGIVGALAAALAQRKNVIQGSDEEDASDDIDDDDDEWDD